MNEDEEFYADEYSITEVGIDLRECKLVGLTEAQSAYVYAVPECYVRRIQKPSLTQVGFWNGCGLFSEA